MGILEALEALTAVARKADDRAFLEQVDRLRGEVHELVDERGRLTERLAAIEAAERRGKRLVYRTPFYFLPEDDVPICRRCWELKAEVANPVLIGASRSFKTTIWECRRCGLTYRKTGPLR